MTTYNTKFSVGDTAYYLDNSNDIVSVLVTDVYLHDSSSYSWGSGTPSPKISYKVSFGRTSAGVGTSQTGPSTFVETDLLYLSDAKAQLAIILAQKAQSLQAMQ